MTFIQTLIYNRLNDWIIKSIRLENDLVNDIIEGFKLAINYYETYSIPTVELDILDNCRILKFLNDNNYEFPIYEYK